MTLTGTSFRRKALDLDSSSHKYVIQRVVITGEREQGREQKNNSLPYNDHTKQHAKTLEYNF